MLPRHQTQPSRELPSVPKSPAITDRGHNRRGRYRPNAFHGGDALALRVLAEGPLDPLIGRSNPGFQFDQLFVEGMEQMPARTGEFVAVIFQQRREMTPQLSDMLRKHDPVLRQQPANLVDQLCAAPDQTRAHAVEALQILLFDRLGRNKTHARPAHRFADRLRIVGVVLLRLHVGLHELRRDQPHRVTQPAQHPEPVVRSAAGFQPDQTGFNFRKKRSHLNSPQPLPQNHLACPVNSVHLAYCAP